MKPPVKKGRVSTDKKQSLKNNKTKKKYRTHPKFGTSKLEQDFARDFLDKLGIKYKWQYEAKDIGRSYDYYLPDQNVLIEIDGSYFHSDPRVVEEEKMNPMQKRNKRVDEIKNKWALMHHIPLYRIWEKDIRENPEQVLKELREKIVLNEQQLKIQEDKKKRH